MEEINQSIIERTAYAQYLYLLGHVGLVHGLLLGNNYEAPLFKPGRVLDSLFLIKVTVFLYVFHLLLINLPGLFQFAEKLAFISMTTGVLAFAISIIENNLIRQFITGSFFFITIYQALLSGWKESVIVPLIILAAYLYPYYRKTVASISIFVFALILLFLPRYTKIIRENTWKQNLDPQAAALIAIKSVINDDKGLLNNDNLYFLVSRFSEIELVTSFLEYIPENRGFFDFQIIQQGVISIIPRVFYPEKPNTELLVMERVRENSYIEDYSVDLSAKPQIVVDGYFSFGYVGGWFFCLIVGVLSSWISVKAEQLFGGYLIGTCVVYTGLFHVFWRGNCLEFMINTIFWSFITMYVLHYLSIAMGIFKNSNDVR